LQWLCMCICHTATLGSRKWDSILVTHSLIGKMCGTRHLCRYDTPDDILCHKGDRVPKIRLFRHGPKYWMNAVGSSLERMEPDEHFQWFPLHGTTYTLLLSLYLSVASLAFVIIRHILIWHSIPLSLGFFIVLAYLFMRLFGDRIINCI
jgi:hypothetical protein